MRVTLYLLRRDVDWSGDGIRHLRHYQEWPLVPAEEDLQRRLFVHQSDERAVRWHDYLAPMLAPPADEASLKSRSASAILFVHAHGRIFAVTFGYGYHALDRGMIELDFGLRVAANSVDPDRVNLADTRGLGKGHRNASSRLPSPNEVFALGLLTEEEWIRRFGGEVKLDGLAKTISGADSLLLNVDSFDLSRVADKLALVLDLYGRTDYLQTFPFLDYFRREVDKELIAELDHAVAHAMCQRDTDIGFASPDEQNFSADAYRISRRRKCVLVPELLASEVYAAIDAVDGWTDPLREVKVQALDIGDQPLGEKEPLRSYTVASTRAVADGQPRDFAMTAGSWFRISDDYVKLVDQYLEDNIIDLTPELTLLDWDDNELLARKIPGNYAEERYNNWLGMNRSDVVVLDRQNYRRKPGLQIEICDVLTRTKQLICVKRMDGSDKLSHLFSQGSVSARMMRDEDYRATVMASLRQLDTTAEFGSTSEWTVVFAIATARSGELKDIMYFFSRAALKNHAESIAGRGFKVAIAKIRHIPLQKSAAP